MKQRLIVTDLNTKTLDLKSSQEGYELLIKNNIPFGFIIPKGMTDSQLYNVFSSRKLEHIYKASQFAVEHPAEIPSYPGMRFYVKDIEACNESQHAKQEIHQIATNENFHLLLESARLCQVKFNKIFGNEFLLNELKSRFPGPVNALLKRSGNRLFEQRVKAAEAAEPNQENTASKAP